MTDSQRIQAAMDEILWREWDPIGINYIDEVRDEYRSYVPPLLALKQQGAGTAALADRLFEIETRRMGLPGDRERCRRVAARLHALA